MKTREDRRMEKQPIDQITDLASQLGYWQDVRRRFLKNRLAVVGFSIIGFLVLVAIVGPFVFRGNYTAAVSGEQLQRLGSKGTWAARLPPGAAAKIFGRIQSTWWFRNPPSPVGMATVLV